MTGASHPRASAIWTFSGYVSACQRFYVLAVPGDDIRLRVVVAGVAGLGQNCSSVTKGAQDFVQVEYPGFAALGEGKRRLLALAGGHQDILPV